MKKKKKKLKSWANVLISNSVVITPRYPTILFFHVARSNPGLGKCILVTSKWHHVYASSMFPFCRGLFMSDVTNV